MKILVTGGKGFLGKHVCELLCDSGHDVYAFSSKFCDLRKKLALSFLIDDVKPDAVIHGAANVGGIGYNATHGAELIRDNLLMGMNILEICRMRKISRLVMIGSVCAYPKKDNYIATPEHSIWDGRPEESNAPYGLAKRILCEAAIQYHRAGWLNCVNLLLANLYGPGDSFDLEKCHVVPALIHKICNAGGRGLPSFEVWGDGKPTRDLLYVTDAARAILAAVEGDPGPEPEPINVASGVEISVAEMIRKISEITGYTGVPVYDSMKPNGQLRRKFDIQRAKRLLNWEPKTGIDEGLTNTVRWFLENRYKPV